MDLDEIKSRMRERGFKQVDMANMLGIQPNYVTKALSGVRRFTAEEMDKIRDWLRGQGELPGPAQRTIPVIGMGQVPAGSWREAARRATASIPSPDPTLPPNTIALEVEGDSMDIYVEDGGTVIVDLDDKALFPKRFYVVMNEAGEVTFKRFMSDPARLVPCSTNPLHQEILLGSGEAYTVVGRVIWRASRM